MPDWLDVAFRVALTLGVIAGVFWFALGRAPKRRSDGGLTQHDASYYSRSNDMSDSGHSPH